MVDGPAQDRPCLRTGFPRLRPSRPLGCGPRGDGGTEEGMKLTTQVGRAGPCLMEAREAGKKMLLPAVTQSGVLRR